MREQSKALPIEVLRTPERQQRLERRRRRERAARLSAVRLVRWGHGHGLKSEEVARDLGVEGHTLRAWERRWEKSRLLALPQGRPLRTLSRGQEEAALFALNETQGRVGVAQLMGAVWPPAARSALVDLKARWREQAHREGGRLCARLEWTRPGSAWAMDWTDPDAELEGGLYTKILVVRDLASGMQILALACERESGGLVARELGTLIRRHGAPAVLKEDNGGSLVCAEVGLVLDHAGILALTSPPGCPGYNGACEAGIGSLKMCAHHLAAARCGAAVWTCDDVDTARRHVNSRVRETGLSAEDIWKARRPVGGREREELWRRYRTHLAHERELRGIDPAAHPERFEQASLDRVAIAHALEEVGLVRFRSRWIRPPIRGKKTSRKS